MRRILYLNNYISDNLLKLRNNYRTFSQPANNKIYGILRSLQMVGHDVTILSSGLVNGKSMRLFPAETENLGSAKVIYCAIMDFPLLNTLSSIFTMYREIKRQNRLKKIDNIIFYNYKPEVAWAAYLAKKLLHIPITVEYEDGYRHVANISGFKAFIFNVTEAFVSKHIDSAILVTSILKAQYKVPSIVIHGISQERVAERHTSRKLGKYTLVYSGGLDRSRGVQVLLDALSFLDIDCHIIITGKGELACSDSRLEFRGFVSYDEMEELMMSADVLLQCQLVNDPFSKVSFPSKLFEYIATDAVIISSGLPDVRQFAGDAFVYYENDSAQDLAKAIKAVYEMSPENRDEYRKKQHKLYEENRALHAGQRIDSILP